MDDTKGLSLPEFPCKRRFVSFFTLKYRFLLCWCYHLVVTFDSFHLQFGRLSLYFVGMCNKCSLRFVSLLLALIIIDFLNLMDSTLNIFLSDCPAYSSWYACSCVLHNLRAFSAVLGRNILSSKILCPLLLFSPNQGCSMSLYLLLSKAKIIAGTRRVYRWT